jgi:hypothetical protein
MEVVMQKPISAMDMQTDKKCCSSLNFSLECGVRVVGEEPVFEEPKYSHGRRTFPTTPKTGIAMDSHKTMQEAELEDLNATNESRSC